MAVLDLGIHSIYLSPDNERDFIELKRLVEANNTDKRRKRTSISLILGDAIKAYVEDSKKAIDAGKLMEKDLAINPNNAEGPNFQPVSSTDLKMV